MPAVETIRPLEVNAPGNSELNIRNRGSNSIYYGDNASVSPTNKTGTLGVGEILTIKGPLPVWLIAEAIPAIVDFREVETGTGGGVAGEELTVYLPAPNGVDDTLAINTILAKGGVIRGRPGSTYIVTSALKLASNTTFIGYDCKIEASSISGIFWV